MYVLEPVATGWAKVAPTRVRTSVSNFFTNLRFPIVAVNDLLQWKPKNAGVDVARFGINTTIGVLGFLDPASGWGLERHEEDFGQTLGVWGVPPGPYLVLPILGPSNPRDAARVGDTVNARSLVLDEVRDAKRSAVDYYSFVRNAYFQRRRALIADTAAPEIENEEELYYIPEENAPPSAPDSH
jgi:phospholipid-binding lipoprotein MlaA